MAQTSNGGRGGVEKWSDLGCILKAEPTGFPAGLDVGCERDRAGRRGGRQLELSSGSPAGHPRGGC